MWWYQTLHSGTAHWAKVTCSQHFHLLDHFSRSQHFTVLVTESVIFVLNWKCYVLIWKSRNLIGLLNTPNRSWIFNFCWWSCLFKGDTFPHLKKINVCFFLNTMRDFFSSDLLDSNLAWGLHYHPGLVALTLFQGHRCVRNINCKLRVLDSCPL